MKHRRDGIARALLSTSLLFAAACGSDYGTSPPPSSTIKLNPCSPSGTLTLAVAATALIDCSAGGTSLTLAGNGASYMIVPQFPTDQAADEYVYYQMFSGNVAASPASANRLSAAHSRLGTPAFAHALPKGRNQTAQHAFEKVLRARAAARRSSVMHASFSRRSSINATLAPPVAGSLRTFKVSASATAAVWATVGARLAYVGANVLVYVDTLAPANGFTPSTLATFGAYFDQTLYPIDTAAFGSPTDLDNNGRVIMLMTPTVNANVSAADCNASGGYIAGFFDPGDFDGPLDPNSNQGEIFYSVVPDPLGQFSCPHTATDVGNDVPATFLHELQHLINYSQHVVISGAAPASSWLDEGMSIVAEELGSLYYEAKCPPPQCRTDPSQLFPDSSQGFIQGFFGDSYAYALLPDTATITLSTDDEDGFAWRGGAWLFARWLGDQMGNGVYRQLERGPSNAITAVQQITGQTFPSLFSNFGIALYADSLPGLPRNTAPAINRFVTRNIKQMWGRAFATGGAGAGYPFADPLYLYPISADSTSSILLPGTMTFFRLDTPASQATVTLQFSGPGGAAFPSVLHAQIAVFRLPSGQ